MLNLVPLNEERGRFLCVCEANEVRKQICGRQLMFCNEVRKETELWKAAFVL